MTTRRVVSDESLGLPVNTQFLALGSAAARSAAQRKAHRVGAAAGKIMLVYRSKFKPGQLVGLVGRL